MQPCTTGVVSRYRGSAGPKDGENNCLDNHDYCGRWRCVREGASSEWVVDWAQHAGSGAGTDDLMTTDHERRAASETQSHSGQVLGSRAPRAPIGELRVRFGSPIPLFRLLIGNWVA